LQPCNRKRANALIKKGKATPFYKKGIFCIRINKEISNINFVPIIMGIDPGSKRTGITVLKEKGVILNILVDTPSWVKDKVEAKRNHRRSRRYRNTPYRKCRNNRSIGNLPPSTKARWGIHLRFFKLLSSVIPISEVVIEDICAVTKEGKKRWNKSFSPLEVGKKWFQDNIPVIFKKFKGYETHQHRLSRSFTKLKDKLSDKWEAHCVDSHSLCEMSLEQEITPDKSLYKISLLRFNRRELHQGFKKGGVRRNYGGTRSLGISRGTLVKHPKYGTTYVGGTSKGGLSLHNVDEGKRLCRNVKVEDLKISTRLNWRSTFLPGVNSEVPS
jgi:hypothetical protein